jgi:hypothetical protein
MSVKVGKTIAGSASWLMTLLILLLIIQTLRKKNSETTYG